MAAPAPAKTASTAEDTLQRKSTDPNIVSGGRLVAKALKSEGVDTIFTLCGGHIIDIYDGCVDEGIRIIDVRHEQVAAHAADGYARQTGNSAASSRRRGRDARTRSPASPPPSAPRARSCTSAARVGSRSTRWARCKTCHTPR